MKKGDVANPNKISSKLRYWIKWSRTENIEGLDNSIYFWDTKTPSCSLDKLKELNTIKPNSFGARLFPRNGTDLVFLTTLKEFSYSNFRLMIDATPWCNLMGLKLQNEALSSRNQSLDLLDVSHICLPYMLTWQVRWTFFVFKIDVCSTENSTYYFESRVGEIFITCLPVAKIFYFNVPATVHFA